MPDIEENTHNEINTAAPDASPAFFEEKEETPPATTRLVKIKFRPAGRHYDFAAGKVPLTKGDRVVVETERGRLRAHHVVRATDGFTARLPGLHRRWVPLNSSLIITETLPSSAWEEIGWAASETVEDFAHVYSYLQRTPDGRIALGGRGTPYRYGSRTDSDGRSRPATIEALTRILHEWFPVARTAAVAHAWSGVLGVPRDWRASVGFDPKSGLASAGGYVGTGVASSHLAGRTLADLLTSTDTARTHLPWVNHSARDWEPEPLRWLAITSIYRAYGWADSRETRRGTSRQSRLATLADLISGR
jgi:glycine/D-amino acid oxidase-like deaminating enzyme